MVESIFLGGERFPPEFDYIKMIAEDVVANLPKELKKHTGLKLVVADFADDFTLKEMNIEQDFEPLSSYQSSGSASIGGQWATSLKQDTLCLYGDPILIEWVTTKKSLESLIKNIVFQEIGHHIGLSDDDITRIEEDHSDNDVRTYGENMSGATVLGM